MAKKRSKSRKNQKTKVLSFILALILAAASFVYYKWCYEEETYDIPEGSIEYHFIDVGQGDAELILVDDKAILIDTSTAKERDKLISYIDGLGIKELEYIVLTHPDEDHIGSADYVINNYKINNVILSPKEHTSATYERMIEAIENKVESGEIKEVINPQDMLGETIMVGELELRMLGPIGEFSSNDNNNPSVVIMARWGNTKVLFTGDAETEAEERIIERFGNELKCDVLKVGHHGSSSSTWESGLLDYAKPTYGIISCGVGNKYGHPHTETLDALEEYNVPVYRTDIDGTIVLVSDGTTISEASK